MSAALDTPVGRGKRIAFAVMTVLVVLAVLEVGAYACGRILQAKFKMYAKPEVQQSEFFKSYDDYLKRRDPRLGWPFSVEFSAKGYDASGARPSPAFPDPAKAPNAVAVFGDSFAVGSEVDDASAWGNQLALLLGARVGNFGVAGYGTDQSLLRYSSLPGDSSRVVILTHLSEGILRHLTRNWDLITHRGYYAMKPRFVLDREKLALVPLPQLSEHEYLRSVGIESPLLPLEHENFQPGGAVGVTDLTFPYSVAVLRNLGAYQVRALFARRPDHAEFYRRDHPLQGLQITVAILKAFQQEATARGQRPMVVLLPTSQDLTYVRRTGTWTYASLVEELDRAKVDYVDFGPTLLKLVGERDVRGFFKPLRHYNEEVNLLLARTVHAALKERDMISSLRGETGRAQ